MTKSDSNGGTVGEATRTPGRTPGWLSAQLDAEKRFDAAARLMKPKRLTERRWGTAILLVSLLGASLSATATIAGALICASWTWQPVAAVCAAAEAHPPWLLVTALAGVPAVMLTWYWRTLRWARDQDARADEHQLERSKAFASRFGSAATSLADARGRMIIAGVVEMRALQAEYDDEQYYNAIEGLLLSHLTNRAPKFDGSERFDPAPADCAPALEGLLNARRLRSGAGGMRTSSAPVLQLGGRCVGAVRASYTRMLSVELWRMQGDVRVLHSTLTNCQLHVARGETCLFEGSHLLGTNVSLDHEYTRFEACTLSTTDIFAAFSGREDRSVRDPDAMTILEDCVMSLSALTVRHMSLSVAGCTFMPGSALHLADGATCTIEQHAGVPRIAASGEYAVLIVVYHDTGWLAELLSRATGSACVWVFQGAVPDDWEMPFADTVDLSAFG